MNLDLKTLESLPFWSLCVWLCRNHYVYDCVIVLSYFVFGFEVRWILLYMLVICHAMIQKSIPHHITPLRGDTIFRSRLLEESVTSKGMSLEMTFIPWPLLYFSLAFCLLQDEQFPLPCTFILMHCFTTFPKAIGLSNHR